MQPADRQEEILEIISFLQIYCVCYINIIQRIWPTSGCNQLTEDGTDITETVHYNEDYVGRILFHLICCQHTQNIIEIYERSGHTRL
jgi:hypothetical protein